MHLVKLMNSSAGKVHASFRALRLRPRAEVDSTVGSLRRSILLS